MKRDAVGPEIRLLLELIDQAYDRKAWHGPNLKASVRGLTAEQAAWRPEPGRHSIAEQVLHAAYWKYACRRRLRGDKRGSFPLKGSNWFLVGEPLLETQWRQYMRILDGEHGALREAVVALSGEKLHQAPSGSKVNPAALVMGVAAHDIYHAGQIQLLKRLYASRFSGAPVGRITARSAPQPDA
jgi:uncharacterized damage-inducible protein DinB